ncbi:MAG: glycerol acyltransferase [Bacteroidaceae bacterium]|nr:glycerol acyltransferase [Bacteroidaceae bacterium]MBR6819536.1 glycerol acyltransferase [Bacteroidaceae bacterium]MBR7051946.1 glycerol acyltransferase [Bacteroidaceae bacterium]
MENQQKIDVDELLRTKVPDHYHKIPRWLIRAVEWLVCQKDLNDILTALHGREGVDFAKGMTEQLHVSFDVKGLDDIDLSRRYLFVSNHPLGAFDGICYIRVLGEKCKKLKVIVNDMLMHIRPLRPVFLPVNTVGRQKREDMAAVQEAYLSPDTQLMTFPAGLCSRYIDGRVQDVEWHKSVITQAVASKRDIVPMYFDGRNSVFFYALERLRRFVGIKFNIGLVLLPRQMVRTSRGKHYHIIIGQPIPYSTFDNSRSPKEWASWLRDQCYALSKETESAKRR